MEQTGIAPVAQGIEHRFPKPNYGAQVPPREPSKCLAITYKRPSLKAIRDLANYPRFPTIRGNCCAEVVLESSMDLANLIARLSRVMLARGIRARPQPHQHFLFSVDSTPLPRFSQLAMSGFERIKGYCAGVLIRIGDCFGAFGS